MKLTNRLGLPQTLVNATERDQYTKGNARISITGLLKPPRIGLLWHKHSKDIEKDVVDSIWALFGKAIHSILEHGGDEQHIPEERLFIEARGWRVSGGVDLQMLDKNRCKVVDYKMTSAWAVTHGKRDWEEQTNCYAQLIRQAKGLIIEGVAICAFIRDWNRFQAGASNDYPQAPTVMIDIPLWSEEKARAFIDERVRIHQEAQALWDMGQEPPHCTDEERWMRTASYAVRKQGNKRASKTFDNALDAAKHAKALGAEYVVDTRKGEPIRCTGDYCSVSKWCSQYREWREKNG